MKLTMPRLFNRMLSSRGYTIDQTILIVAIIAILITLIILTVAWQLINRSSGTKLGAQLKQVEDANGQFFADQRVWPYVAFTASNSGSASVLALMNQKDVGVARTWATNINQTKLKNLLPGFSVDGTTARHNFGSGGVVTTFPNKFRDTAGIGTDTRMVVQFTNVPLSEAKEADQSIDGVENASTGRVIYGGTGATDYINTTVGGTVAAPAAPGTTAVTVLYAANAI